MYPDPNEPPSGSGPDSQSGSHSSHRSAAAEPTIAFCQQCGRPLSASTRRQIGDSIFCEPCAIAYTSPPPPNPGWTPVAGATSGAIPGGPQTTTADPNPKLAGWLGLIPGVGAMYNGQYAKAAIHLVIFVILLSVADNFSVALYWLVWGWVFYQAFEAYHTALARLNGQPLPDPFGWNDLGDRLGTYRVPPSVPRSPQAAPGAAPPPAATAPGSPAGTPSVHRTSYQATSFTPVPVPDGILNDAPVPPVTPLASAVAGSAHSSTQVPYTPTYNGPIRPASVASPASAPTVRRFPVGALWLIALGIIFLIGNIAPNWRLSGRWIVPFLLAIVALWAGTIRVLSWRESTTQRGGVAAPTTLDSLASALLLPAMLFTFAVLLTLQIAGGLRLTHSWPALLIVWGAMLLLGRIPSLKARGHTLETAPEPGTPPTSILG